MNPSNPAPDTRSPQQRARDEQIASEPLLEPPELPPDVVPLPLETHLAQINRPVAMVGVVENGLVRPLDPDVTLPEQSRVIIVASEGN